ncbi:hypothetical protein Tco_0861657 [Tanacetum coccineum]|uniref:Uncharacterized protein n=1 Tax=Tanacetum coccineum TaxID=301880 RepID=A0ABQ5BIJ8_9ASTR
MKHFISEIKIARAVTSKEDVASQEILHRKMKRVKFNSVIIIFSKLTNGNKVFNDVRSDKNIMQVAKSTRPRIQKAGLARLTKRVNVAGVGSLAIGPDKEMEQKPHIGLE